MTLPKAISDAIDAYSNAGLGDLDYQQRCRAALERAIEDHVAEQVREAWRKPQPADGPAPEPGAWRKSRGVLADHVAAAGKVVPPSDAEIEAAIGRLMDAVAHEYGDGAWDGSEPVEETIEARDALRALMRRAAAARKLMQVQFGDVGSGKLASYEVFTTPVLGWSVGDPLPNLSVEVGGKMTRYVPEQAAATPAPSALDRLRERVRAVAEAIDDAGNPVQDETTRHAFGCVLRWIDEEKAKAGEAGNG